MMLIGSHNGFRHPARNDLADYMAKKSRNNKTINLARELLKKAAPLVATRKTRSKRTV
jgi:hypothetical protein